MASTSSNPHLSFDAGLLLSTDSSALDAKQYANATSREILIQSRVLASTKGLLSQLYALPITMHPDHGPLAALPAPTYPLLPREKPLPKPKAETKWEAFAKRKGIQHRKKEKMVYDEETKEWVPSWGFKGKNKKEEQQWIHEIPAGKDDDFNPVAALKKVRKEKNLHNKAQQLKNVARASAAEGKTKSTAEKSASLVSRSAGGAKGSDGVARRKAERDMKIAELDAGVKRGRASTASMGRFDKHLEGEGKEKGLKRKFDANEVDVSKERASNLALIEKMTNGAIKSSRRSGDKGLVNERKAVRFASAGKGSAALAKKGDKKARR